MSVLWVWRCTCIQAHVPGLDQQPRTAQTHLGASYTPSTWWIDSWSMWMPFPLLCTSPSNQTQPRKPQVQDYDMLTRTYFQKCVNVKSSLQHARRRNTMQIHGKQFIGCHVPCLRGFTKYFVDLHMPITSTIWLASKLIMSIMLLGFDSNSTCIQTVVTYEILASKTHNLEWILNSKTKCLRSMYIQEFNIRWIMLSKMLPKHKMLFKPISLTFHCKSSIV